MKNKYFLFILTCGLFLSACDQLATGEIEGTKAPTHTILLEFHQINYAWGFFNTHSFLTSDGKIAYFFANVLDDPRLTQWTTPDESGLISEEDLAQNLMLADSMSQGPEAQVLEDRNIATLVRLVEEELGEPVGRCIDAGEMSLWAYHWNEEEGMYQRKLVEQCGDIAINNEHDSAANLLEQLDGLMLFLRGCCF